MTEFVSRFDIVGKKIRRVLQTPWTEPVVHCEGLGEAVYCTFVFELSDGLQFSTFNGELTTSPPTEGEPLIPAEIPGHENCAFRDQIITDVIVADSECTHLVFLLDNDTAVTDYQTSANGNRFVSFPQDAIDDYFDGPYREHWDKADWQPPPRTTPLPPDPRNIDVIFTFRGPKPPVVKVFQGEAAMVDYFNVKDGRARHKGVMFLYESDGFWNGSLIDIQPGVFRFRPYIPGYVGHRDIEIHDRQIEQGTIRIDFDDQHLHRNYIPGWLRRIWTKVIGE